MVEQKREKSENAKIRKILDINKTYCTSLLKSRKRDIEYVENETRKRDLVVQELNKILQAFWIFSSVKLKIFEKIKFLLNQKRITLFANHIF